MCFVHLGIVVRLYFAIAPRSSPPKSCRRRSRIKRHTAVPRDAAMVGFYVRCEFTTSERIYSYPYVLRLAGCSCVVDWMNATLHIYEVTCVSVCICITNV